MKVVFGILAALLGILAGADGVAIGLGALAYSVWIIILMVKGTVAVTFFVIFKVISCWIIGPTVGWLWGAFFAFLASLCAAASSARGNW